MTQDSSRVGASRRDFGATRRELLVAGGAAVTVGLAGCTSNPGSGGESGQGTGTGGGQLSGAIDIAGSSTVFSLPTELSAKTSAMPLQVYAWASPFASEGFYTRAVPAGVVVLVGTLLAMNSIVVVLRNRYQNDS